MAQQSKRMRKFGVAGLIFFQLLDALGDMVSGQLAVGADVIGLGLVHLPEHRAADFQGGFVEFFFHAPCAGVAID